MTKGKFRMQGVAVANCYKVPPGLQLRSSSRSRKITVSCRAKRDEQRTPPTADASLPVKTVWYLSEAFGNVAAGLRKTLGQQQQQQQQESSGDDDTEFQVVDRQRACELIRKDYDQSYFVTGKMTSGIYMSDCEFADPFVSFKGLKRFQQNVSNLGAFMEKSTLKIASWEENEGSIKVGWRFSCVLGLPWRPIISATGSTEYFFDEETGKISKHVERWNITPADGVRQLFKRSRK